jgi:putative ABC transport system ATP-binding protein
LIILWWIHSENPNCNGFCVGYNISGLVEFMSENHIFQLSNVSMHFGEKVLFENFNLTINQNEVVGLTGCSGSGKSTILRIIVDFLTPDSGDITILGKPISDWDPRELRRTLILVPQESQMFTGTVRDNLLWGLIRKGESIDDDSLYEILREVNLDSMDLDEDACNLSGGEKQRVAIARALVMNPKALLLDEPTSALDDVSALAVENVLNVVIQKRQIGILIVTHNKEQAQRFTSRIIEMENGLEGN